MQRLPVAPLTPLSMSWLFTQWGMNILGPFFQAIGRPKFLLVAIDYFIKWIEVELLAKITKAKVKDFLWKSILCRFGLPRIIIIDNDHQFNGFKLAEFYQDLGITLCFTSINNLQANGNAKVVLT